jgi:hypothetical protein
VDMVGTHPHYRVAHESIIGRPRPDSKFRIASP